MMAWHYTTGEKARAILASGFIRPATAYVPDREKPIAWFSLNQSFEPTAAKGVIDTRNGSFRHANLSEMHAWCEGLFRFGIEPRQLLCGNALIRKARISRATWTLLCQSGVSMGADPNLWFGFIGALPIDHMAIQHMPTLGGPWTDYAQAHEQVPA